MQTIARNRSADIQKIDGTGANKETVDMRKLWILAMLPVACGTAQVDIASQESPESQAVQEVIEAPVARAPRLIRLTDMLDDAKVVSPMKRLDSMGSVAAMGDSLASKEIYATDFSDFDPGTAGWPARGACTVDSRFDPKRGAVLRYHGQNPHKCIFVLPVEPRRHYRINRGINTANPGIDLGIMETRVRLKHPRDLNHSDDVDSVLKGRFVGMGELVLVHHLPRAKTRQWDHHSISIFTSAQTHSLVIQLQDPEQLLAGKGDGAMFDDLIVEELQPTMEQELAVWKDHLSVHPSGLVKHGQMLPIRPVRDLKPPFDNNYDYRYALFAPTPTQMTFKIHVAANARLSLSTAPFKASKEGEQINFVVRAKNAKGEVELLRHGLEVKDELWHWHEHRVSLQQFTGEHIELTLETSAPDGQSGIGLWGSPVIDVPRSTEDPPNILLIAVDTLRADRMQGWTSRPTSTRVSELAKDSVTFANAIAAANWTSPSFASLFTGMMPSRHQVIHRVRSIAPQIHTLTEHLRDKGWITHAIAYKAYLYNMGFEQGFDTWFNVPDPNIVADDNLGKTLAWLEGNGDQRFFLFLHFNDTHQPFNQPDPFVDRFTKPGAMDDLGVSLPVMIGEGRVLGCRRCVENGAITERFKPLARDLYDGEIAYVDDRIGRIIDTLKERGIYNDTIIAFVSDHGELMWEHDNYFGHGGATLYDELIHVPLIIKPAADFKGPLATRIDAQVGTIDLMPTLLDMTGVTSEALDLDNRSLVPLMLGPASTTATTTTADTATDGTADTTGTVGTPATTESTNIAGSADRRVFSENIKNYVMSVRDQGWKYVVHHRPNRRVTEQLFWLNKDPQERDNIIGKAPARLAQLREQIVGFVLRDRSGPFVLVTGIDRHQKYDVRISGTGLESAEPIIGLAKNGPRSFAGKSRESLVLFAQLKSTESAEIEVVAKMGKNEVKTRAVVADLPFGVPKDLHEFLNAKQLTIHLFRGAPPAVTAEKQEIDGQQLEALRAMGYIQ